MRFAGFVFGLVACAQPATMPPEPVCEPQCFATCGNGIVDACAISEGLGCSPRQEECDGTVGASCTSHNYYGGTGACTGCRFDGNGCNACAVTCVDMPSYLGPRLAASETHLAIAHEPVRYGPSRLTLLDASLNEVATTQVTHLPTGIAAVPDGWLLVEYAQAGLLAQHVDMAGAVSPSQPLCELCDFAGVAYGPGGRALVVFRRVGFSRWFAVILDASGAVVVQPFEVYPDASSWAYPTVATDGTSFFVAARGQLAVIGADGSISKTAGYPMGAVPVVSWNGSTGWYVAASDETPNSYTAQAFDATGALVGLPVSITTMSATTGLQAYGSGLIGTSILVSASAPERRFAITRVAATGDIVASTEVGVVATKGNPGNPVVVPFASGVAVAWSTADTAHVALVTP